MQLNLLAQTALAAGLIIIMFGIGLSLTRQDFLNVFAHRTALSVGLAAQIVGLPLAAALSILLFDLAPEYALGLMIIASSPGGATINARWPFPSGATMSMTRGERSLRVGSSISSLRRSSG